MLVGWLVGWLVGLGKKGRRGGGEEVRRGGGEQMRRVEWRSWRLGWRRVIVMVMKGWDGMQGCKGRKKNKEEEEEEEEEAEKKKKKGRESTNLIMNMISPSAPEEIPQTPIPHPHPLISLLHHLPTVITPLILPLLHLPHERALEILMARHRARTRPLASQIRHQRVKNRIVQHLDLVPLPIPPEHASHDPGVEIHPHSHTAAQQVRREGGVGGEGYDGGVVVVGRATLDPLFRESARAGGGVREEQRAHVAQEQDVHVAVDAAVEVKDDEADSVGDLDGGKGGVGGFQVEPLLAVGVLDDTVCEDGFAVFGHHAGPEVGCRGLFCAFSSEWYSFWESPAFQ